MRAPNPVYKLYPVNVGSLISGSSAFSKDPFAGSSKKQESSRKTSISALLEEVCSLFEHWKNRNNNTYIKRLATKII